MRINEVMTREVKSLSPNMSAKEAIELLFKTRISGLPVVDVKGGLVGMFTEKDVLKNILPTYLKNVGNFVYVENPKGIRKKVSNLERVEIKDIMRKEVVTIGENATLCEAARIMLTQNVRRIPVLDKEGRVIGMVAREDVVRGMLKQA